MFVFLVRDKIKKMEDNIKVGDYVVDRQRPQFQGVVVKIVPFEGEYKGCIFVWQQNVIEHGADNCEHYEHYGWKNTLEVVQNDTGIRPCKPRSDRKSHIYDIKQSCSDSFGKLDKIVKGIKLEQFTDEQLSVISTLCKTAHQCGYQDAMFNQEENA